MFGPGSCWDVRRGITWFYEGVKDSVWKDGVVVVWVVFSCVFNVNMESFDGLQVCSLSFGDVILALCC